MKWLRGASLVVVLFLGACSSQPGASSSTVGGPSGTAPPTTMRDSTTSTVVTTPTTATAPTTTSEVLPLAGRVVVIDPGHNGRNWAHPEEISRQVHIGTGTKACNTTGTSGEDYAEATFTWELAQLTVPLLESAGATVVLTRHDNDGWGPCVDQRAGVGNDARADAVVSIHADGGPPEGRGFHVIHPALIEGLTDDIHDDSFRLATALHSAFQDTGMPIADYIARDGFSERGDLGGLNLSDVPAVFLEAGNMRNAEDLALLHSRTFQKKAAQAIVDALVDFLSD